MTTTRLHLFEAFGIELEYMIVDRTTLDVRPISDQILRDSAGGIVSDVEHQDISWSNELTAHVIELKTTAPTESLKDAAAAFARHVARINEQLASWNACLLPTAMHPWMDPHTETRLWAHDSSAIYQAFHRVFDCRGHGWANLQSMHLNLPFADDTEFAALHAAVRIVLPLLPGLAASSPLVDGRFSPHLDARLNHYRTNSRRVREVTGRVIPEPCFSEQDYNREILQPLYRAIQPFDPDGLLQDEYLNARGAIARFGRGSIEIRVIDVQECPAMDLAVAALTIAVIQQLAGLYASQPGWLESFSVEQLERLLLKTIDQAELAVIDDAEFLAVLGLSESSLTANEIWNRLFGRIAASDPEFGAQWGETLRIIFDQGTLARRIHRRLGADPNRAELLAVYAELAKALQTNTPWMVGP